MRRPVSEPRRPLRVLLVEFLPSGGLYQFSFLLGEALAQAGHEVVIITGRDPEVRSTTENLQVLEAFPTWHPGAQETLPSWLRKLRRIARAGLLAGSWLRLAGHLVRHRYDVVQFSELRFMLDSLAVVALGRLRLAGALVDVAHNPLPYDVSGAGDMQMTDGPRRRALAAAYRAFALIMVLGEGPREQLRANFTGLPPTVVSGHGEYSSLMRTDPQAWSPPSAAGPRVLFFGSWARYKNLTLLLDAFEMVRRTRPDAELVLAGPVMADTSLDAVRSRAEEVGGVDLRPGYVDLADVPALFAEARVVALPYEIVNISGVVHLAYTLSRPVVATDVGSMTDAVVDGATGVLSPPEPEAFAAALLGLLDDADRADRMGAAAREHAEQHSGWSTIAETVLAAYRDVLAAPGRQA